MEFFERFDQINPKTVYIIMALALIIPVLKPVGLPVVVNKDTTEAVFKWVEGLSPGDVIVFDTAYSGGSNAELAPQLSAWFKHCMKKGVKVIGVSQWLQAGPLAINTLEEATRELEHEGITVTYGVDWVYIGYKAGGTVTWRAMQNDFWRACADVDYYGKSFKDLPLMAKLPKWTNEYSKGIFVLSAGSPGTGTYTTYFAEQPMYIGNVAVQVAGSMNLLRSGQAKGVLAGLRGAAEYEKLLGKPGYATKLMDAQSMGHLTIMVLVVLGNISFALKKRRVKQTSRRPEVK